MTDREALEALFKFMVGRNYCTADLDSVRDMVQRYVRPPLTRHYRVAMQMTVNDYKDLSVLLDKIDKHLNPKASEVQSHEQSDPA